MMVLTLQTMVAWMKTSPDELWAEHAKGVLRGELKKRNMTYRDLAALLDKAGHPHDERNLTNKVARGSFTAAFLLECLRAIGCESLDLRHLPMPVESR